MDTRICNAASSENLLDLQRNTVMFDYVIRKANVSDISALRQLIDVSVRELAAEDYTPAQIDASLRTVFSVDTQLVEDGTYFVVEQDGRLLGCGGWSQRKTLCGGDHFAMRDDTFLDPLQDAAKIRAIFVHPRWARRGIGSFLLKAAEDAAMSAGFTRLEMGATLTGVPLYLLKNYQVIEQIEVPLEEGVSLTVVRMAKTVR